MLAFAKKHARSAPILRYGTRIPANATVRIRCHALVIAIGMTGRAGKILQIYLELNFNEKPLKSTAASAIRSRVNAPIATHKSIRFGAHR